MVPGTLKLRSASCMPFKWCLTGSLAGGKGQTGRLQVTWGTIIADTSKRLVGHTSGNTWK